MLCRNVFLCIQQFGYATKTRVKRKLWTAEETKLLQRLVSEHGPHWAFLVEHFEGRTPNTLAGRYHYLMKRKPIIEKAQKWNEREDELLLSRVDKFGCDWVKIAEEFQGRHTEKDISDRFLTLRENSKYKDGAWSKSETKKLDILVKKYKNDWVKISEELGTRSKKQCYYRYANGLQNIVNPSDDNDIKLKTSDAKNIVEAVNQFGTDFKLIKKKLGLQRYSPEQLEQLYKTQLDPAICRKAWTKEEEVLLVDLYRELDGCMKLVQTRLPRKRSLQDMWDHYLKATQTI